MDVAYYLVPLALSLGAFFLVSFIVATAAGEFDDLETPAHRILIDDEKGEAQNE